MQEEKLTLNDGTELAGYILEDSNVIWVYLYNMTLVEGCPLLIDSEKTSEITAERFGAVTTYSGYTHLFCVTEERNGQLSAGLKKG